LTRDASLEETVELIRSWNEIQSERVGLTGRPSVVHAAFLRLKQLGDAKTLQRLVADPSPAVRVYAFRALVDGNPKTVPFEVLLGRADDVAKVGIMGGDVYETGMVIDQLVAYVEPRLSVNERTRLLERLLQSTPLTPGTEKALDAWRVEDRLYGTIRERVLGGTVAALPSLARFRREADLPLIEKALSMSRWEALGAVADFPSPIFLPVLRTIHDDLLADPHLGLIDSRHDIEMLPYELPSKLIDPKGACRFYQAVAAYSPTVALPFFTRALDSAQAVPKRPTHAMCIGGALESTDLTGLADLAFRLWEVDHLTSSKLVKTLLGLDRPRALRDLETSFQRINSYDHWSQLRWLIALLKQEHPAPARVLGQAMATAGWDHFIPITIALRDLNDPDVLPALFQRLEVTKKNRRGVACSAWEAYGPALSAILKFPLDDAQKARVANWILKRGGQRRAGWTGKKAVFAMQEKGYRDLLIEHGLQKP
jgi:hypothetical protein